MLGWIKTALGIGSGISWVVYAVLFGLGVAAGGGATWRVMQWHVNEVTAERDGAQTQRDVYKAQIDGFAATHADDVKNMNACKAVLADQSDAVAKLQFSLDQTNAAAQRQAADSAAGNKALADRVAELQAWAAAHQDKVCKLSPEMRDRAAKLFQ